MNEQVNSSSYRLVERTYSDPSAVQERAMTWKRDGLKNIAVRLYTTSHGTRVFVLSAMATDEQVRAL